MTYGLTDIGLVETWSAASYAADDIALIIDVTTCMKNGTPGEDCDEWKEGTENCKVFIMIPPSAITALSVRFYFNSVMTAGYNSLLPYTDEDSVSNTYENNQDYTTPGQWIEHASLSANFLSELGDLGGYCAVRLASNDGAKSKLGEVNIDVTYSSVSLNGISKDKDGVALGSCEVALFRIVSEGPPHTYEYVASTTSHATTGAWSFSSPDVWDVYKYMVQYHKEDTPHVFDCTDNVLVPS